MGASGAGKTTLLNILTSRRPGTLKVSGEVRVNGTNMGRNINRVAGYVQQEELFVPSMTTREHLFFHVSISCIRLNIFNQIIFCLQAMLRLSRDIPKKERINRVEEILDFVSR